jgi:hypothetical protein
MVNIAVSGNMLSLDALCWGKADPHKLVPDGARRVHAVIANRGLKWPEEPA